MAMSIEDYNMNPEELTMVTKNLVFSLIHTLDIDRVEEDFFRRMGDLDDEKIATLRKMFSEMRDELQDVDKEIDDLFTQVSFPELFENLLSAKDEKPEEEPVEEE